jgi:bifunctional non-homologous end joining protein LigD
MNARGPNAFPKEKIRFIEPMYARLVNELPEGKEWLYEVKFDGYRCLAGRDGKGVILRSRRGNLFTKQFPNIARACEKLPPGTLVDGEIVARDESGRISFNLLQHHRSKAQALLFYAFDVLIYRGRSLLKEPLEHRRQVLAEVVNTVTGQGRASSIALSDSLDASADDLVRVAKEFGLVLRASSPSAKVRSTNQASEPDRLLLCLRSHRVRPGHAFVLMARKR